MSSVAEIQSAIEKLSLRERTQLAKWFTGLDNDAWDDEMARDFGPGGRLETLKARVRQKVSTGPLLDLP